jgi:transposase
MFYGLDVHKRFIQVCELSLDGKEIRQFRVDATASAVDAWASRLGADDEAVLEATFHSWALANIIRGHAGRVVVANPTQVKAIAHARVKTDKVDALILAQLLRAGFIPEVEMPDEKTWAPRQLCSHRRFLGEQRTRAKNVIASLLNGKLLHCPHPDLFTVAGRKWIAEQSLTNVERAILDNSLRLLDEVSALMTEVDQRLTEMAREREDVRLLMTILGIDTVVAHGILAAIGDIGRFASPDKLASYFGLVPRVSQSADRCHYGRITKAGSSNGRWLAVEAAQMLSRSDTPMAASFARIKRRKGHSIAITALARKLVELVWHMLTTQQPYRYAKPDRTWRKLRRVSARTPQTIAAPHSLTEIYARAGLPELRPASASERRVSDGLTPP